MDLTVAVINYDTREALERCLESMPVDVGGEPLQTLVVDNASPDGSANMVARRFGDRVKLLANRTNLGFARAVNQALEQSSTRYLLVLNADTEIPEGAIEALYDFMERTPTAGVAGGKLLDADGNLQHSCRGFYTLSTILLRRTPLGRLMPNHRALREHLMLDWDHDSERTVDWMQGACLMLRREAVEQVGAMDERFFLYFEDVDLCRRMAEGGWGVHYVPDAPFVHHYRRGSHGGLLSREKLHHIASGLRYWAKWSPRGRLLLRLLGSCAPLLMLVMDLALINLGFLLCLYLRDQIGGALPSAATDPETYYPILVGGNSMLLVAFGSAGLYRVERSKDWLSVAALAIKAITWVALAGMVFLFFAPGYRHGFIYSRLTFLLYYLLLIITVPSTRLASRRLLRALWRRRLLLRRVIVVGEPDPLRHLVEAIRAEPVAGYQVVAEQKVTKDLSDNGGSHEAMEAFERLMERHQPQGAIFVTHQRSFRGNVPKVLHSFEHGLEVRVATSPDVFPYIQARTGDLCGQPASDVTRPPLYELKRFLKRVSDLALTLTALAFVTPLLLLLALAIRLQDGGPAFFVQKRVGKHGLNFGMLKLRTMKVDATVDKDANIAEGPLTLIPNDPRVTPIGRWLRRHKLDELPQLFNVISGQMSLVGPRPPTAEEVQEYTLWQRGRLAVRPGITGLWQIDKERKWRFNEMVELDLQYILNWSLLLDYGVLLRTIPAVLRGS
jgi:exopolysaccharide biosynthesis polyprenyl glycosylphosphotransferase